MASEPASTAPEVAPSPELPETHDSTEAPAPAAESTDGPGKQKKEKTPAYVNPDRVKTGGSQRDKLSDEALQERMARIKEQNEKIKQRRLDVQADEDAFKKTQDTERVKQAQTRRVQNDVDRAREQNAKRKMDKIQMREWDSGKPPAGGKREGNKPATPSKADATAPTSPTNAGDASPLGATDAATAAPSVSTSTSADSNWSRGGRGGGRGRGRGRGGVRGGARANSSSNVPGDEAKEKSPEPKPAAEPAKPVEKERTTETSTTEEKK